MTCAFGYHENELGVLLVRHAYGRRRWHLPGGEVMVGELPEVAAVREYREETGLDVVVVEPVGSIDTPGEDIAHLFIVQIVGGRLRTRFDREIADIGRFPYAQLPSEISNYALERIRVCGGRQ